MGGASAGTAGGAGAASPTTGCARAAGGGALGVSALGVIMTAFKAS
eukprot:CAMPEP_0204282458 /NCGR_PEP_ID=MMETSP0468-20130131/43557_1 /ASSEMBLY_ACC=CAM_ASM_000383 /TAXON_ID=2969 /ORGANISM="Oxyrrhis marina" /LENGTH=45 /DNA_ID= /DNA_START= /DNA_END= /DNA_ORIENTATION=